jgi:uncharacterized protein (DUF2236 family)
VIQQLANSFRTVVSGDPVGKPKWVDSIETAEGVSIFLPNSPVWEVHGSVATLVGGIRALLLQAAHPAALAGVMDHSRYETDLLGRLQGTSRWLTITTFGTDVLIAREAARVNEMHKRVEGTYVNKEGNNKPYQASNERFLLWVHCAFTESFLEAHRICRYPLSNADLYISEWAKSAKPLGLDIAPRNEAELKNVMNDFAFKDLRYDEKTKRVISFIINPPFGFIAKFFYRPLAKTAVASLTNTEREILNLKKPMKAWVLVARLNLALLKMALGKHSPAQEAALKRIERRGI